MFIDDNSDQFDIARMCKVLEVSRSSFYDFKNGLCSDSEIKKQNIKELIHQIWVNSSKRYGAPKIAIILKKQYNVEISQKTVQKYMKEMNIKSIITKTYKPSKFKPDEGEYVNLLKRDFTTTTINEKWVSDITYVYTNECGWCYLATILDLHSKRLIGWKFDKRMTTELVQGALENAIQTRKLNHVIVLHSDRGRQYTAEIYRNYCCEHDFNLSYSEKGCPYDNAPMESFNAIIKKELVNHVTYDKFDDARISIFNFIEKWYNRERIHGSIGNMTPIEFEQKELGLF